VSPTLPRPRGIQPLRRLNSPGTLSISATGCTVQGVLGSDDGQTWRLLGPSLMPPRLTRIAAVIRWMCHDMQRETPDPPPLTEESAPFDFHLHVPKAP